MSQAWFWPPSGQSARSQSLAAYGSETLVLDAFAPTAWPFSTSGLSPIALTASGATQIQSAVAGTSGDVYALGLAGNLFHIQTGGAVSNVVLPSGIYAAVTTFSGQPYSIQSAGKVVNATGAVQATFFGPTVGLTAVSNDLATLSPSFSGGASIGFSVGASAAPTYTVVSNNLSTPTCLAGASGLVAVGGWASTTLSGNFTAMAVDSAQAAQVVGVGPGQATVYTAPTSGSNNWTALTSLSGVTAAPVACDWTPNGTQVLIADNTNNAFQELLYSGGVLSIAQTLTVSGANSVVATDNTHALVGGNGQVTPLLFTSSWAAVTGNVLSLPGVKALVSLSGTSAVAACTSGVAFLTLVSNVWSVASTSTLGFAPTQISADNNGTLYASAPGHLAVVQNITGTVIGSGTWSGDCRGIAAYNLQAVAFDASGFNGLRVMGAPTSNTWATQSEAAALPGGRGLLLADRTLFAFGTTGAQLFNFGAPYTVVPVRTGAVGVYTLSTSGWVTAILGPDHVPSCLAWSTTGVWAGTYENDLYGVTTAGAIGVSGIVPQYGTQPQTVPLGVSALQVNGSSVLAATSMAGLLVQAE